MRTSRVYNIRRQENLGDFYDLYPNGAIKIQRSDYRKRNIGCQCNARHDVTCTCRRVAPAEVKYFCFPKQVYRYSKWRSFTDIGVGSIKALPRKRIRKIYLPDTTDRAVGSEDLSSIINRRNRRRWADNYYDNKKTSSKCVGGYEDIENVTLTSKKLSPIIQKKSVTTSTKCKLGRGKSNIINSNSINKHIISTPADVYGYNTGLQNKGHSINSEEKNKKTCKNFKQTDVTFIRNIDDLATNKFKCNVVDNKDCCKDFSSDSLVQHVYNLENPSYEKHSKMSVDPMENKLEREYRNFFMSKSKEMPSIGKPISDLKSKFLLRGRFEALRRGLGKKESKKDSIVINKMCHHVSEPSRKDVSILCYPPYLEGKSYSNVKENRLLLPTTHECRDQQNYRKSPKSEKVTDNYKWSTELTDSKYEGIQGIFKSWRKKFDLNEDYYDITAKHSKEVIKNQVKELNLKSEFSPEETISKKKKGRKFFFFRKKHKEKDNKSFKLKKGVTAGRCEIKDGLTIKVGVSNNNQIAQTVRKPDKHLGEYEDILRKVWLDKYITKADDSRKSVHIRWNNKMYAASSSTALDLIDGVYKQTGIDFKSLSEITTGEISNYRSYMNQRIHFMQQDIETWMIPNKINKLKETFPYEEIWSKEIPIQISDRKWYTDSTKELPNNIDFVVHSKPKNKSANYVIINIPEGYFSQSNSSDGQTQSSDERIYKIVEYDTCDLKKIKETHHMAAGVSVTNNVKAEQKKPEYTNKKAKLSNTDVKPSVLRDVATQGSDVFFAKRCDVISVGIITQRDIRDVRKPILQLNDELLETESDDNLSIQKTCEFAESYLQEYCCNWRPSVIDLSSWHMSDMQLCSSEVSITQGDGIKSCPNVYDDFQEPTTVGMMSSYETSSCNYCIDLEDLKLPKNSLKCKFLNKFKNKYFSEAHVNSDRRNFPKDSLEVYKKRQFYARTNQKSKWCTPDTRETSADCTKSTRPCWKLPDICKGKKGHAKRVSFPGSTTMCKIADQLSDRSLGNILSNKGSSCNQKHIQCPKRANALTKPVSETAKPGSCVKETDPKCRIKNSQVCDEVLQKSQNPNSLAPCEKPPDSIFPSDSAAICPQQEDNLSRYPCTEVSETKRANGENPTMSPKPSQECLSPKSSSKNSIKCLEACGKKSKEVYVKKTRLKDYIFKRANAKKTEPLPTNSLSTANCIPQSPPTCCPDLNIETVSGLYLKMLPSKKNTSCNNSPSEDQEVISINSGEKITIHMKNDSPNNEEAREGLNIKVQDEDGQTLYERINYKQSGDRNKSALLKNIYNDTLIHRASTSTISPEILKESKNDFQEDKSSISLDNLIEINFTLKLKQGDMGTKVDIKSDNGTDIKRKDMIHATESQKHVYRARDQNGRLPTTENNKDVNINIVIKNYKTDSDRLIDTPAHTKTSNDIFNKRISEKFQTVSTGYSDVIDHHAFSIQKVNVGLTTSTEVFEDEKKVRYVPSKHQYEDETKERTSSSLSINTHCNKDQTINSMKYEEQEEHVMPNEKRSYTRTGEILPDFSPKDRDNIHSFENSSVKKESVPSVHLFNDTSNETMSHTKIRLSKKSEKKEMLKSILQNPSLTKNTENKNKVNSILRDILTSDSSGNEDAIAVTNNELVNELTYGSLDPFYYRDTDSMNNYYKLDSDISDDKSVNKKLNLTTNNSECSYTDTFASFNDKKEIRGCLCAALASKLNLTKDKCCCRRSIQRDEETTCDFGTTDYILNLKSCVGIETQNSIRSNNTKVNCTNLSIASKTRSTMENVPAVVEKKIDRSNAGVKKASKDKRLARYLPSVSDLRFNREAILDLSDDEIVLVNSDLADESICKCYRDDASKHTCQKPIIADILQLNETKKAVLEIYAEKIISDKGERLVAKLPKFDLDKGKDFKKYESVVIGHRRISKRNFVMLNR